MMGESSSDIQHHRYIFVCVTISSWVQREQFWGQKEKNAGWHAWKYFGLECHDNRISVQGLLVWYGKGGEDYEKFILIFYGPLNPIDPKID